MRCLVTGGCGFIGSHLVNRLVRDGHDVRVFDNWVSNGYGKLDPGVDVWWGSVTELGALMRASIGVDVIFHLAAIPRIEQSVDDPLGTHEVNVTGTLNVLKVAQESGVRRVVYSSSSSVYGDQLVPIMHEDMVPNPVSPYGLHKLIGEQYAAMFGKLYGLSVVSLRYFNVYGPGQPSEGAYALVIPKFLKMKAEGKPLTVYGNGEQTRAYVHVSDVVEANILAATAELVLTNHTVLNIGTGTETSVNDIAAIVGGPVKHISNPRAEFEEMRKAASITRAYEVLGWEPRVTFAGGMRELQGLHASPDN